MFFLRRKWKEKTPPTYPSLTLGATVLTAYAEPYQWLISMHAIPMRHGELTSEVQMLKCNLHIADCLLTHIWSIPSSQVVNTTSLLKVRCPSHCAGIGEWISSHCRLNCRRTVIGDLLSVLGLHIQGVSKFPLQTLRTCSEDQDD